MNLTVDQMIQVMFAVVIVSMLLLMIGIIKELYKDHIQSSNQRRAEDIRAKKDKQ